MTGSAKFGEFEQGTRKRTSVNEISILGTGRRGLRFRQCNFTNTVRSKLEARVETLFSKIGGDS